MTRSSSSSKGASYQVTSPPAQYNRSASLSNSSLQHYGGAPLHQVQTQYSYPGSGGGQHRGKYEMSEFTPASNPYINNGNNKNGNRLDHHYNGKTAPASTMPVEDYEEEENERGQWGSKAEFILSCIGYSVRLYFRLFTNNLRVNVLWLRQNEDIYNVRKSLMGKPPRVGSRGTVPPGRYVLYEAPLFRLSSWRFN